MAAPKSPAAKPEAPLRCGLPPMHPGELLREVILPALKEAGTSRTKVADLMGVGRRSLYDLLDEKSAVTPDMALRLGKLLGNGPDFWLNLQRGWDLAQARDKLGPALDAIPTIHTAEAA